jgi:hypothetical protein
MDATQQGYIEVVILPYKYRINADGTAINDNGTRYRRDADGHWWREIVGGRALSIEVRLEKRYQELIGE